VVCAGAGAGRPHDDPLNWLVPPLLRAAEYGAILWLASLESATAVAAGFVLLAAVAFRQYDLVYRLRHRAAVPPRWVSLLGLGWDGRVVLVWLLLLAGALPGALYVAGGVLACAFVAESAAGWLAYARSERTVVRDGEDDEDEDQ
jgi:hypothetical protein